MIKLLIFAIVPVLATLAGCVLVIVRPPGPRAKSAIQHFAAGVVFSVVSVELLPDIIKRHAPSFVVIGFTLGLLCMLGLRSLTQQFESESFRTETKTNLPMPLLGAVLIDIVVDGFLVGIGFAVGSKEGLLLTAALSVELLSLGVALSIELIQSGIGKAKTLAIVSTISMTLLAGTIFGAVILSHASDSVMEGVLSFGLASLLFLVTEELLTEAHEQPETPLMTSCFFVGFLVFLILGMIN